MKTGIPGKGDNQQANDDPDLLKSHGRFIS
jgi:hypothetical protein